MKIGLIVAATGCLAVPLPLLAAPVARATALQRPGAVTVGRVLDAQGKPVAGAWVAPLEIESIQPTKSAADGSFALPALPAGQWTILAAKDRLGAAQKVGGGPIEVELRLAPPAPFDIRPLLEKWIARGPGYWLESDFSPGLGAAQMERLVLRGATPKTIRADESEVFALWILAAARDEPAWTRSSAARLLSMFAAGEAKKNAEAAIAVLRASGADALDQKAAAEWLEREKAEPGGIAVETVTRYLSMARVAQALKQPEADSLLDFAAQIGDQLSAKTRLSNALKWGARAAPLGEAAVVRFVENWEVPSRLAAWSGAVSGLGEIGEVEAARRALKTLELLVAEPIADGTIPDLAKIEVSHWLTPPMLVQNARGALVRALSQRDPAAALAESALIVNDATFQSPLFSSKGAKKPIIRVDGTKANFARQNALLWVANGARLRGDKATATTALRQVFEFNGGNNEPYALAAWYGAQIDSALGDELFALAQARVEKPAVFGYRASIGDLAFYLARLDPARSRLLIEREWSWRAPTFAQKSDPFGGPNLNGAASKLVRAMLLVDPTRAAEMVAQLEEAEGDMPDLGGGRAMQRYRWVWALVADEAAQARGDLSERP